ncbi:MAG: BamA/TamA family outer membrane protein [Pseudomonadota bacterium]
MTNFSTRKSGLALIAAALALTFFSTTLARAQSSVPGAPVAATSVPAAVSMTAVTSPASGVTQTAPAPLPPPRNEPPSTPPGAVGPTEATPQVTAFDIVVRAPPAIKTLLEQHLELQRYRAVTDLDDAELARLVILAERNVRNLVGTLGFFSPDIKITREGAASQRPTIVVAVDTGQSTLIDKVDITFTGDIEQSPDAEVLRQKADIKNNWRLPPGQRFTQDSWDGAKTQALRELVARRYPAGKIANSVADIDAPSYTAMLGLRLDSGPLYRLGKMEVSGVERYNPVLVPRLARLREGAVYDQKELNEAQQRLASSGYFDSATIFINPESDPQATPVQVQVREAKLQKVILGVGLTTDSGPRVSLEHTHLRVPGTDWRAVTKLQLERKSPSLQTEWTSLPDEASWRWVGLARAERMEDDDFVTTSQRLRFGRTQAGDRIDRNIYMQFDRARVQGAGLLGNTAADAGDGSAISANYVWTGRYFDSLPFPGKGYGLGFELGGGVTLSDKRQPYLRTVGRWLGIHSLASGRIAMRAEAGAVMAKDDARVPSTELFRTGGDTTVRGYGYRDIGIALANGVVGPGRYMAVGSVEWQRPIRKNGLLTEFENTLFIDAGAVGDKPQDLRPSVGIGTGVRWKSPIGPLQIDLAYGIKAKQLRLHTSVGFIF